MGVCPFSTYIQPVTALLRCICFAGWDYGSLYPSFFPLGGPANLLANPPSPHPQLSVPHASVIYIHLSLPQPLFATPISGAHQVTQGPHVFDTHPFLHVFMQAVLSAGISKTDSPQKLPQRWWSVKPPDSLHLVISPLWTFLLEGNTSYCAVRLWAAPVQQWLPNLRRGH